MRQMAVNVRRARREQGLTQQQLAQRLGVHARAVQSWEAQGNPQRIPHISNLKRMADLTGHPVAWFYEEHDDVAIAA